MKGSSPTLVLAVSGLQAEARIAAGAGVVTVSGGGDAVRLDALLRQQLTSGAKAIISFGIAGGLAPGLAAGTVVVADRVIDGTETWQADASWLSRLSSALPHARRGTLVGVDVPVTSTAAKQALHGSTGALAVDMESHVAVRLAASYKVPFAALRVIADPAGRALPRAATVGMRPDGSMNVPAVLLALIRRPGELGGLIATARDANAAFTALRDSRRLLSPLLAFA